MKKVKEAMKAKGADDAKVTEFEKGAQTYAKKIIANFKDYDFYIGESMDPDGMYVLSNIQLTPHTKCRCYPRHGLTFTDYHRVILMNYREDGTTPFVTVWKHGLTEMKV